MCLLQTLMSGEMKCRIAATLEADIPLHLQVRLLPVHSAAASFGTPQYGSGTVLWLPETQLAPLQSSVDLEVSSCMHMRSVLG